MFFLTLASPILENIVYNSNAIKLNSNISETGDAWHIDLIFNNKCVCYTVYNCTTSSARRYKLCITEIDERERTPHLKKRIDIYNISNLENLFNEVKKASLIFN